MLESDQRSMSDTPRAKPVARLERQGPEKLRPCRIGQRDLAALTHLAQTKVLSSGLIARLLTAGRPLRSDQVIVRRLRDLYDHQYISRVVHTVPFVFDPVGRVRGSGRILYVLAGRGAEEVARATGSGHVLAHRWDKTSRELRWFEAEHELAIGAVYTTLRLAERVWHPRVSVGTWRQGRALLDTFFVDEAGHLAMPRSAEERASLRAHTVFPDAFFSLLRLDPEDGTTKAWHYLLELDRSTQQHERFLRKLKNYARWRALKLHTNAYGIGDFTVLTVCRSRERRDQLARLAKTAYAWKTEPPIFRFCYQGDFSLDEPQRLAGPIWRTAADERDLRRLFTDPGDSARMPVGLPQLTATVPQTTP